MMSNMVITPTISRRISRNRILTHPTPVNSSIFLGQYMRERNRMTGNVMHRTSYQDNGRKARLLCAVRLISGFGTRYSAHALYEMALSCYDLLLDMIEDPGVAGELSASVHMPSNEIQASAEGIIDHLLFNPKNDPYIVLGLQGNVSAAEVTRRWKRLIILYHPDRYPNQKNYEERAKKINQAYAEIQRMKERGIHHEAIKIVKRPSFPTTNKIHYFRYMKRLPAVIIAAAILAAIISMLLFVSKIKRIHSVAYPERETRIAWSVAINTSSENPV